MQLTEEHVEKLLEHFDRNGIDNETSAFLIETIGLLTDAGADLNTVCTRMGMFLSIPTVFFTYTRVPGDLDKERITKIMNDIGLNTQSQERWMLAFDATYREINKPPEVAYFGVDSFNQISWNAIYEIELSSIVLISDNNRLSFTNLDPEILANPDKYWIVSSGGGGYDVCILFSEQPQHLQDYNGGPTFGLPKAELYRNDETECYECSLWERTDKINRGYLVIYDPN